MRLSITLAAFAAAALVPVAAQASGIPYQASSFIVGQTPTGSTPSPALVGGGDPIYFANSSFYSGTVALIMQQSNGLFICTGSLLPDRQSILTAGHCVSSGSGTANPIATTAYFFDQSDPNVRVPLNAASTAVSVSQYFVNPNYTGEVIDDNDIAVLRLSQKAPTWATDHNIWFGSDLTGQQFNVAGYGSRSTVGGDLGANARTGYLRQGLNEYAFRWGDSDWQGFFDQPFWGGNAEVAYSYVSDFDNGLAANDAACILAGAFGLGGSKYCGTFTGAREVGVAGGDSGGPQFIGDRIASVTSYGLTFGAGWGDITGDHLDSSFGEFSGYVPTFIHAQFIHDSMVPEPGTWAMMILGIGAVGYALRRRTVKFGSAA